MHGGSSLQWIHRILKMALSTELLRRLDKEDEPLPKRLRLAFAAFESNNLPVQRKEELILNWLCEHGEESNSEDIWSVLEACLNSSHMKLSGTTIRPSVKASVSQVFTRLLQEDTALSLKIILLNCAISVIEHANFQQHFKRQLVQYFELLTCMIECAIKKRKAECCIRILQNIALLNKQVTNKEEFSVLFISKLIHIIKIQICFEEKDDESLSRIRAEVFKCVQQVLFPKSRFKEISLALRYLFTANDDHKSNLLGLIFEFLSSIVKDDVSHRVYSVTFHAFVASYKTDPQSVCRMFIVMCHFIGFNPEMMLQPDNRSRSLLKHKKFKETFPENNFRKPGSINEKSMSIIRMLLVILSESNVELNDDVENLPFHGWLLALISEVFSVWSSSNDEKILASLLEVMCAFIKLDPLIIQSKIGEMLESTIISKKESSELKLAYTVFLHDVLEMFMKLSRLQKLVTQLLALRKTIEGRNAEELAELSEVFTSEFSTDFRTAVALLPGWETIRIIRTLLYHFKEDCVAPLENPQGDSPTLFLQMTSELLCQFLRGTRVAEHSVPKQVVSKFTDAMIELQSLLGKLGQAILQREHLDSKLIQVIRRFRLKGADLMGFYCSFHCTLQKVKQRKLQAQNQQEIVDDQEQNCALMRSFMQLCYNWGEMKLLLLHYGIETEANSLHCQLAALQEDLSASNFSYLHPYLSSELWNLVAQRITNFAELDIKELLEKMVLQKLRSVVLFVEEGKLKQDVTAAIAWHVASHIKDSTSFILTENNSSLMLTYLNPEHLELIANHFLHEVVLSNEAPDVVLESKKLIVAFTCSTLNGILKLFSRTKRKHDSPNHKVSPPTLVKDILSKIDSRFVLQCFFEDDMDSLAPLIAEMSNIITAHLQKEKTPSAINGNKFDQTALHRYLQLLKSLPLQYASSVIKSLVVLSMLALAITLEEFGTWKKNELSSSVQELLYKDLLIGILDGPDPPTFASYLDMGLITHWLSRVDICLTRDLHCLLFQRLFLLSLSSPSSLMQLQTSYPIFQKHVDFESEDLEPAVAFLQILNEHLDQQQNLEEKSLCEKYQRRLSQGLVKMLEHLEGTTPTPAAFDGFNLILRQCLKKGDLKQLDKLTAHLSKMVGTSLSQLEEKDLSSQLSDYRSYIEILATVLKYRQQLKEFLPEDLIRRVWSILSHKNSILNLNSQAHWKLLFTSATQKEFQFILKDLTITRKLFTSSEVFEDLKAKMTIWKVIVISKFNDRKINSRKLALEHLCQQLTVFLQEINAVETERTLLPIVDLLTTIAQNTMLYFSSEMLDLCFKCINTAFVKEPSNIFNSCSVLLRLLQTLMQNREAMVLDCIPSLLQCYRQLAEVLASHGQVKLQCSPAQVQQCTACVHRLERLTNSFKNNKPHFARVAPYLVADLLHIFETYTLYPEIKLHYTNSIHALLVICDRHALSFLSRNLTPASQQLLKTFHTSYIKYHRFTGKV